MQTSDAENEPPEQIHAQSQHARAELDRARNANRDVNAHGNHIMGPVPVREKVTEWLAASSEPRQDTSTSADAGNLITVTASSANHHNHCLLRQMAAHNPGMLCALPTPVVGSSYLHNVCFLRLQHCCLPSVEL